MHSIVKLSRVGDNFKNAKRPNIRVIIENTEFTEIDKLKVVDLQRLQETQDIKPTRSKYLCIQSKAFENFEGKQAILQPVTESDRNLIVNEAVKEGGKEAFIIETMDKKKSVLMSVITENFLENLKLTEQKKLF